MPLRRPTLLNRHQAKHPHQQLQVFHVFDLIEGHLDLVLGMQALSIVCQRRGRHRFYDMRDIADCTAKVFGELGEKNDIDRRPTILKTTYLRAPETEHTA